VVLRVPSALNRMAVLPSSESRLDRRVGCVSIAATRRADVFRALMDVQSLYRIHSIRNHTEKALSYSRDLVDTLYDRARLVHYLDALLRVPQNSPPKSTPIAPPRLRRRWVVLATTAALDHAFYLPIVARVRTATLVQCSAHCALPLSCTCWAVTQGAAAGTA
jgi:hypothetical protein